jgi:DNA-binding protein Fis
VASWPYGATPREVASPDRLLTLAEVERQHIERVLSACQQNQGEAAKLLGISRTTLWRKLSAPA